MKYKVGDRVKIKSLDWYTSNKNKFGKVWTEGLDGESQICFDSDMIPYCGMETVIFSVERENYVLKGIPYDWTDEMLEGLVEDTITTNEQLFTPSNISLEKEMEWNLPEGYQFVDENGNVINTTKIVLEKKKKEYPKTFEECVHVLEGDIRMSLEQMNTFRRLIDSRNAYWKIAGEEMGLDKPWEPKDSSGYCTYAILRHTGHIRKSRPCADSALLEFPTEEMRAAFYENFKEEIEQCKELL